MAPDMQNEKSHKGWVAIAVGLALAAGAAVAADHVDSPLTQSNPDLDITDVYVFRSPVDTRNLVIAVDHQSVFDSNGGHRMGPLFANDGTYQIFVDRDGDLKPDVTITTHFADALNGRQSFQIEGLTDPPIVGDVTQIGQAVPYTVQKDGVQAFCGPRDDPFFFDLVAFNDFIRSPYIPAAGLRRPGAGAPQNFFRGNVASIVLEIPIQKLTGSADPNVGKLKIWAKTFRN